MAKLSDKELEEWQRSQDKPKEPEPVPSEEEELEASGWNVEKKKPAPKIMTPKEVEDTRPTVKAYNTPVQSERAQKYANDRVPQTEPRGTGATYWPDHERIEFVKKKHETTWEPGNYEVIIERVWKTEIQGRIVVHVGFMTKDGRNIQRMMSDIYSEKSTLGDLVMAIWGQLPEKFVSDDLVGQTLTIGVKIEPNKEGVLWEKVKAFFPSDASQFKNGG